jgi:hypothetical protein
MKGYLIVAEHCFSKIFQAPTEKKETVQADNHALKAILKR